MAGKADMIEHLAGNFDGLTKKLAGEAIDAVFNYIQDALANGDRVQIPSFGTFTVGHRKARQGLNPHTKEPMHIPASNSVRFKPGKQLKDAVN
jgi:DNA-binding protein HU-beta